MSPFPIVHSFTHESRLLQLILMIFKNYAIRRRRRSRTTTARGIVISHSQGGIMSILHTWSSTYGVYCSTLEKCPFLKIRLGECRFPLRPLTGSRYWMMHRPTLSDSLAHILPPFRTCQYGVRLMSAMLSTRPKPYPPAADTFLLQQNTNEEDLKVGGPWFSEGIIRIYKDAIKSLATFLRFPSPCVSLKIKASRHYSWSEN